MSKHVVIRRVASLMVMLAVLYFWSLDAYGVLEVAYSTGSVVPYRFGAFVVYSVVLLGLWIIVAVKMAGTIRQPIDRSPKRQSNDGSATKSVGPWLSEVGGLRVNVKQILLMVLAIAAHGVFVYVVYSVKSTGETALWPIVGIVAIAVGPLLVAVTVLWCFYPAGGEKGVAMLVVLFLAAFADVVVVLTSALMAS